MAVTKLKLLSISGGMKEFSTALYMCVNDPYLHIEDATAVLKDIKGIVTVAEENPYKELLASTEALAALADIDLAQSLKNYEEIKNASGGARGRGGGSPNAVIDESTALNIGEAMYFIKAQSEKLNAQSNLIQTEDTLITENRKILEQLEHIRKTDVNLSSLFQFEFCKFRFGHMPREAYDSISLYSGDLDDFFFVPSSTEQKEVWGLYFTPRSKSVRIDSMFKMLHFERVRISDKAHGTPEESLNELSNEIKAINARIDSLKGDLRVIKAEAAELIDKYYAKTLILSNMFELRKKTVRTMTSFHIIIWLPANRVKELTERFAQLSLVVEPINASLCGNIKPPTLFNNPFPFKPFEQFVEMYGLPSYNEIDPTPFIAFTYILFFGIMFADVGQGLVLSLAGFLLWFMKRINLGRIIGIVGVSSMIFGVIFGSVFGLEDLIHGYNPLEHIDNVLLGAVALGAVTISAAIVCNIVNGLRQKNYEKAFFSHNGLVGLAFYWTAFAVILIMMNVISLDVLLPVFIVIAVICLLAMYLREPLGNLINGQKKLIHGNLVEFIIGTFFEMFEIVLSFLTNTVSFLRIGAFALNHVGMMTVVLLLSKNIDGSSNPIVFVLGNLVVIGLEGLVVGIQCLRLEYYEILGRFFEGNGRRFESSAINVYKTKK